MYTYIPYIYIGVFIRIVAVATIDFGQLDGRLILKSIWYTVCGTSIERTHYMYMHGTSNCFILNTMYTNVGTCRCPLLGGWKYTVSIRKSSFGARKLIHIICIVEIPHRLFSVPTTACL